MVLNPGREHDEHDKRDSLGNRTVSWGKEREALGLSLSSCEAGAKGKGRP